MLSFTVVTGDGNKDVDTDVVAVNLVVLTTDGGIVLDAEVMQSWMKALVIKLGSASEEPDGKTQKFVPGLSSQSKTSSNPTLQLSASALEVQAWVEGQKAACNTGV